MSSPGRQGRSVPAGALPQEFLAARQDQKSREESESTRMTEAQGPKEMEGIKYSAQENSDAPCRPGLVAMRESKRRMTDGREVPQGRQQGPMDPTDRMDALIRDAVERTVAKRVDAYLGGAPGYEGDARQVEGMEDQRQRKEERSEDGDITSILRTTCRNTKRRGRKERKHRSCRRGTSRHGSRSRSSPDHAFPLVRTSL